MQYHFPRWEQLPQIALYMDQVLLVLKQVLDPLSSDGNAITATMINNYVKMKLAAPAEKKKYDRDHMARFLMICLMKKVLSMAEIAAVLDRLLQTGTLNEIYDRFCMELERRLETPDGADSADCPAVLAVVLRAVACKIHVEKMLQIPS